MGRFLTVAAGVAVLLAGGVAVARRRLLVIEVVGDSMAPTYVHHDRLLVRRTRRLRPGDVVIAHHQEGGRRDLPPGSPGTSWLVKRLAAGPGDAVPASVAAAVGGTAAVVPPGAVVLLGDSPASADSRRWGFVPADDVAGVVVARLGSPGA